MDPMHGTQALSFWIEDLGGVERERGCPDVVRRCASKGRFDIVMMCVYDIRQEAGLAPGKSEGLCAAARPRGLSSATICIRAATRTEAHGQ
jgi:hypothetical protein